MENLGQIGIPSFYKLPPLKVVQEMDASRYHAFVTHGDDTKVNLVYAPVTNLKHLPPAQ